MVHVDSVENARRSVEKTVQGWTVCSLMEATAARDAEKPALTWKAGDRTCTLNWGNYRGKALEAASALLSLGGTARRAVAVLAGNRPEHMIVDAGALHCGMVSVSLYPTLAPEQLEHILADCVPQFIFVEAGAALARVQALEFVKARRPTLVVLPMPDQVPELADADILTWEKFEALGSTQRIARKVDVGRRLAEISPSDHATYIYTSGTTGKSKGVVLSHFNLVYQVEALQRCNLFNFDYRYISYLPLAHIAERLWSIYLPIHNGGNVMLCADQSLLIPYAREHRPTYFFGVPRVWEKLMAGIEQTLKAERDPVRRDEVASARRRLEQLWEDRHSAQDEPCNWDEVDSAVRSSPIGGLLKQLGLDQVRFPGSAAAPLQQELARFFASLGLQIRQGYGLTETGGVAAIERLDKAAMGSVGRPLPGAEAMVAPDGEILIKSPANCVGYLNLPEATADLYTTEGWLRSGDLGRVDENGNVFLTDRKKEIIINASGKNIAPTGIESLIAGRSFIAHTLAYGDMRPYLVALLAPDPAKLEQFARSRGLAGTSPEQLASHPEVVDEVRRLVDAANTQLSRPEQIKRFQLLPNEWRIDSGELTPTFKLRRRIIHEKYQGAIGALYEHGT